MVTVIESLFPRLRGANYQITSPADPRYNCIAWAAGNSTNWWWPELDVENGYWPTGIAHEVSLNAFVAAFAALGYVPTDSEAVEPGWERIALFAVADGTPSHAARQLPNGRWTSKLGKLADIEHELHDLTGTEYGAVVQIMKRPLA
jgi:hypothetical protein